MNKTSLVSTIVICLHPFLLLGQDHGIESSVISGGGGTSASGHTVLRGTVGEPVAGFSSSDERGLKAGFWNVTLEVLVEPNESFETWMANLPDAERPPPDLRGPLDEPAGDGASNLLKYAFGLKPMAPATGALPRMAVDNGFLEIRLERSSVAAVGFQLEGSPDLKQWENVPFTEQILEPDLDDNRERVRLLTGLAPEDTTNYFLRLRVRMP